MNRFISPRISPRIAASAALALGILGAATAAHARSDVVFSIGVQSAPVYYEPARTYHQPAPVYYDSAPAYVQPQPVYTQPRHVYVQPVYGERSYGYANDWRSQRWERERLARDTGPWGDLDRDGILNKDDRDRDGDGVRNRHDRFPDNPYYR